MAVPQVGQDVDVIRGRLKGAGGRVTAVHDEYDRTIVTFTDDLDGRRRSVQVERVQIRSND